MFLAQADPKKDEGLFEEAAELLKQDANTPRSAAKNIQKKPFVILIRKNNESVGFIHYAFSRGVLSVYSIFVVPSLRRTRIATSAVRMLKHYMAQETKMEVILMSPADKVIEKAGITIEEPVQGRLTTLRKNMPRTRRTPRV